MHPHSFKILDPMRVKESLTIKRVTLLGCDRRDIDHARDVLTKKIIHHLLVNNMLIIDEIPTSDGDIAIFADIVACPIERIKPENAAYRKGLL